MPNTLWKPVTTVNEAIDRYAAHAVTTLESTEERRRAGEIDEHYLQGHYLTAIAYLLRALKDGEDPDQAAAMVPDLLNPAGPADTWANILTPVDTEHP